MGQELHSGFRLSGAGIYCSDLDISGVGLISTADGTSANPSHSFDSDPNTGMHRVDADKLALVTGGSIALNIDNNQDVEVLNDLSGGSLYSSSTLTISGSNLICTGEGKVGIGTSAPTGKLHIVDPSYFGIRVTNSLGGSTSKYGTFTADQQNLAAEPEGFLLMGTWAEASRNRIAFGGSYNSRNAATELSFYTAANTTTRAGTERMTIKSDGKVGIGTTSPSEELEVVGTISGSEVYSGGGWTGTFTNGDANTVTVSGGVIISVA